ncbi:MAG: carbohydrate-binding family 9-like protein, partial [Balneolaceae bacterium]
ELEDPHVWATITERDAVIFMDNNFEIFIDPDGDTHNYYELEINALGTFWDLLLTKPYRNGGRALNAWDIKGLKIGISINGTINDPSDTDKGWMLEVAIPWEVLMETLPGNLPADGDQWKLNYSRVQWHTEIVDGKYVKQTNPETGELLPEENWSWSPQGLINMHYPEMWGTIQFSDEPAGSGVIFEHQPIDDYKWLMRVLYYRQIEYRNETGRFAGRPQLLQFRELFRELFNDDAPLPELTISLMDRHYIMKLESDELEQTIYIQNDSRVWTENK